MFRSPDTPLEPELDRHAALSMAERLCAVHGLMSSLEYLARRQDREFGGLNNWQVMRRAHRDSPLLVRRALDGIADQRVTATIHTARAACAVVLLLPVSGNRVRLGANLALASTTMLLRTRHRYGGDGADQVAVVVQTATALGRTGGPRTVDACLWFIALQSVLSYVASGCAKLANPAWRDGTALTRIMATRLYGHPAVWRILRDHPKVARALSAGILAFECGFPLVFLARGRLAPLFVSSAIAFHLVNGGAMGLGRFGWAFIAMHPAVLYVTRGPRDDRSDLLPRLALAGTAGAIAAAAIVRARGDDRAE
ncbi:hypothetical protein [Nonomuraea diastatica]|uniref:HTTM-like domain-containing protein n=1 Tax=Nonomuraea diastatica TaxID=1848329 RepID=A0A4R4WCC1_9ACTN|nr:hypothetical protein [Nonomuraea diastatica]TDD14807.1 hypothetical protein E1294_36465 [Nonomuraea diastatica]